MIQYNTHQTTSVDGPHWPAHDATLIGNALGVGFFLYGPRLWMVGEVEPLKALQKTSMRADVIDRVLREYPTHIMPPSTTFYRLRISPSNASLEREYDSPPSHILGKGRFDSANLPVLYGSQDIQIYIHECRVSAEDETFLATLRPVRELKLLDLTEVLQEETTEFESLDMAIHMLFLAGRYSYKISQDIALRARNAGFDGLIYPSYFSLLRTGLRPFETTLGISFRRFPQYRDFMKEVAFPNLAIFGRPVQDGLLKVDCMNRLVITSVGYSFIFGPVGI